MRSTPITDNGTFDLTNTDKGSTQTITSLTGASTGTVTNSSGTTGQNKLLLINGGTSTSYGGIFTDAGSTTKGRLGLQLTGAGTKLTMSSTSGNTFGGGTTISSGAVLSISSDNDLGAAYTGALAGVLVMNNGSNYTAGDTVTATIAGSGGATAGTVTLSGTSPNESVDTVPITAAGSGYIANEKVTFSGGTGSGATATAEVAGLLTLDGGTLEITSGISDSRAVNLTANNGTIQTDTSTTSTFTGNINSAPMTGSTTTGGGLTKTGSGTLTLTGGNTYTGATSISTGTLGLGIGGSIATSKSINVAAGATFDVHALTGGYSLGGSVNQTLSGGGTVNNAGMTTTIGSMGTLSPSSVAGTATTLTFSGNGSSNLALAGATTLTLYSGSSYDSVAISGGGTLTYGGSLTVAISGTESNATYILFTGISSATTSGDFSPNSVMVDGGTLSDSTSTGTWTGMGNGGENVTFYTTGTMDGDLILGAASVPEPGTWALCLFGLGMIIFHVRRRSLRAS